MPTRKTREEKKETRVAKVPLGAGRRQLNHLPVAGRGTSRMLHQSATTTMVSPEVGDCPAPSGVGGGASNRTIYIPVQDRDGSPLMPTHPARARELLRRGKAVRRFSRGVFYIRLTEREGGAVQEIVTGIDPGSKMEGFTVKSEAHTYLNIQAAAVTWVKDAVKARREMRRTRRNRNTPCRQPRANRAVGNRIPPSTRARWGWKLRVAGWLSKLYPISGFRVEDIKARTTGRRRWDVSFSPLEVGKTWFYDELRRVAPVDTNSGWETKELRDNAGLKKSGNKIKPDFYAHCVDSWVMANSWVGGHVKPDNIQIMCVSPIQFHRRQLHALQPSEGGVRRPYGSTRSLGFKRGSLVKHPKYGTVYVGGTMGDRVSLHSLGDGKRLTQSAVPSDCKFLAFNTWRRALLPPPKGGGFPRPNSR